MITLMAVSTPSQSPDTLSAGSQTSDTSAGSLLIRGCRRSFEDLLFMSDLIENYKMRVQLMTLDSMHTYLDTGLSTSKTSYVSDGHVTVTSSRQLMVKPKSANAVTVPCLRMTFTRLLTTRQMNIMAGLRTEKKIPMVFKLLADIVPEAYSKTGGTWSTTGDLHHFIFTRPGIPKETPDRMKVVYFPGLIGKNAVGMDQIPEEDLHAAMVGVMLLRNFTDDLMAAYRGPHDLYVEP